MSNKKKQSYYAAIIEREKAKQALLNSHFKKGDEVMNCSLKDDISGKMYDAFLGILNMLASLKINDSSNTNNAQINDILELKRDISSFINRADKTLIEIFRLSKIQYGIIAKLTNSDADKTPFFVSDKALSNYESISESSKYFSVKKMPKREKIPKSQIRETLLSVANKLKSDGQKASLTEISKISGIPYHKIVYACKDFAEFHNTVKSNVK